MSDAKSKRVLVKRPARIKTDSHGLSVWADPVESAELELVSTQMLKVMLTSRDDTARKAIEAATVSTADGVLARHPASGRFEIIADDELKQILDANRDLPKIERPADATLEPIKDYPDDDHLSLVSTRALRKVFDSGEESAANDADLPENKSAGFNPYNTG